MYVNYEDMEQEERFEHLKELLFAGNGVSSAESLLMRLISEDTSADNNEGRLMDVSRLLDIIKSVIDSYVHNATDNAIVPAFLFSDIAKTDTVYAGLDSQLKLGIFCKDEILRSFSGSRPYEEALYIFPMMDYNKVTDILIQQRKHNEFRIANEKYIIDDISNVPECYAKRLGYYIIQCSVFVVKNDKVITVYVNPFASKYKYYKNFKSWTQLTYMADVIVVDGKFIKNRYGETDV